MIECVEAATQLCEAAGPAANWLALALNVLLIGLAAWRTRQKLLAFFADQRQQVAQVATKVDNVHDVVRALSTPPPALPSASSPALIPVVIPAQPVPAGLSAQVEPDKESP